MGGRAGLPGSRGCGVASLGVLMGGDIVRLFCDVDEAIDCVSEIELDRLKRIAME